MNNRRQSTSYLYYFAIVVFAIVSTILFWSFSQRLSPNAAGSEILGAAAPSGSDPVPLPSNTPLEGYPSPVTQLPVTIIAPQATAVASPVPWTLTATAGAHDGITYDFVNRFSIVVSPDWFVHVPESPAMMGVTTISNYDPFQQFDTVPVDIVSVSIFAQNLGVATSFEQWLAAQRAQQTSPENGVPFGTVLTDPVRQKVGHYDAVTYYAKTLNGGTWQIIYLIAGDQRVLSITIPPVSDPQGQAGLVKLNGFIATIEMFP